MPTLEELEAIAAPLGLPVVLPSFLGADAESIAKALDAFTVVLRWDAAHGGVDGETGSTEAPEDLERRAERRADGVERERRGSFGTAIFRSSRD